MASPATASSSESALPPSPGYIRFSWEPQPATTQAPIPVQPPAPPPPTHAPVHAPSLAPLAPAPVRPKAPRLPTLPPPQPAFGPGRWNAALDWCLALTGGSGAFLMAPQGLVVACRGDLSPEVSEGVGARVLVAWGHLAQLELAAGPLEGVCVRLATSTLTLLWVGKGPGSVLLGVQAAEAVDPSLQDVMAETVGANVT